MRKYKIMSTADLLRVKSLMSILDVTISKRMLFYS